MWVVVMEECPSMLCTERISAPLRNKSVAKKRAGLLKLLNAKIEEHQKYIVENGDDPAEVKVLKW